MSVRCKIIDTIYGKIKGLDDNGPPYVRFFFFFEKYKALAESKQFGNLAVLFEYCYHFTTCLNSVDEKWDKNKHHTQILWSSDCTKTVENRGSPSTLTREGQADFRHPNICKTCTSFWKLRGS